MKLKYYLRGLGIGILAATIILMITFSMHGSDISDAEVIRRAELLGMERVNTEKNRAYDEIPATENAKTTEQVADTETAADSVQIPETETTSQTEQIPETEATPQVMNVSVVSGDSSKIVVGKLYDAGLVEDAAALNSYIMGRGLDSQLKVGDYQIPVGSTYEEIVNILVGRTR